MRFLLTIDCDNAAFKTDEDPANARYEVARILTDLVHTVQGEFFDRVAVKDINGNTVGQAEFVDE